MRPGIASFAPLSFASLFHSSFEVPLSRTLKTIQRFEFSVSISIGLTALFDFRFLPSLFACRISLGCSVQDSVSGAFYSSLLTPISSLPKRSTEGFERALSDSLVSP